LATAQVFFQRSDDLTTASVATAAGRHVTQRRFGSAVSPLMLLASVFGGCNGPETMHDNTPTDQCGGFTMPNPASAGLPNAASYADNGDGTVTDKVTGLMWERFASASTYAQADATKYCTSKGSGWRLPTRLELVSLVDFTVPAPGPTINQAFSGTPGTVFWTSSPVAGGPGSVWGVFFDIGYTDSDDVSDAGRVRCMSAIGAAPKCYASRYQVKTAGEVYDAATGLTWQRDVDANSYPWSEAKAHCSALSAGWRLPSMTELQSIVDDTRSTPAMDPSAFPNQPGTVFWTSSPVAGGSIYAWGVDFSNGTTINPELTSPQRMRCVR
jgi:hypothetical protein